jgi:Cu(I)/Ag(I) efflux system membrane fusion protein
MSVRWKRGTLWAVLVLAGAGALSATCRRAADSEARATIAPQPTRYHCPMHPTYVSDKPGDCPICGMRLVPMAAGASAAGETVQRGQDTPGVAGRGAVVLTPERRQMLGIRSEEVRRAPLTRTIRTVGRVAPDERRLHHVHTKYEGYVEHLYVDFTGKFVRKGEPLLSLYSPELVATQQEYLLAWRAQKQLAASGIPAVEKGGVDLLEAARQRLLLWDIRAEDIERLEKTGQVKRTLDLHSEISGYVVQKMAVHGMRVMPADTLFDIADLSSLWVLADVYESDLPSVRLGMVGEVSVPYIPGRTWRGPVTYIAPTVEEKTRTIKVRIEVANAGEELKPDMFADVFLESARGSGVVVPESAVIDAGDRRLVFLDRGEGRFEPREVKLGARVSGGFEVLAGLAEGDRVVTSANFLLDSESSLKAALSAMGTPSPSKPEHVH